MSTRTEFVGVETRLGRVDLDRGVATVSIVSRYMVYRTTYRTTYNTVTYSIVSRVATELHRTYTLEYGNLRTQFHATIPTNILLEVRTFTITGQATTPVQERPPAQERPVARPLPRGTAGVMI